MEPPVFGSSGHYLYQVRGFASAESLFLADIQEKIFSAPAQLRMEF
jgi:hypothetical protein